MSKEDKPRRGDRVRVTFEAEFVNGDDSRHAVVDIADGMGPVHIGIPAWSTVEVLERADDPSADLTGSIRRTKAVTCVARERDGGAGFHRWIAVEINEAFTDDHMRGSHIIGAVPGTPADEVTVTGEDIDRWAQADEVDSIWDGEAGRRVPFVPQRADKQARRDASWPASPRVFRSDGPEPPEDVECARFFGTPDRLNGLFLRRSVDLQLRWVWVADPMADVTSMVGDTNWPVPNAKGDFTEEVLS